MDEEEESDRVFKLINNHVLALMEHFDSVHIFCTKIENKETTSWSSGDGNWNARRGQVRDWMIRNDAIIQEKAIQDMRDS